MDSKKSMHTADLYPPIIYDQESGQDLTDEFFYGRKHQDIIFQPQKENDHRGSNKILEFGRIFKIDRQQTAKNKACKNSNPTQRGNGNLMDFARIRHIK